VPAIRHSDGCAGGPADGDRPVAEATFVARSITSTSRRTAPIRRRFREPGDDEERRLLVREERGLELFEIADLELADAGQADPDLSPVNRIESSTVSSSITVPRPRVWLFSVAQEPPVPIGTGTTGSSIGRNTVHVPPRLAASTGSSPAASSVPRTRLTTFIDAAWSGRTTIGP
jgi:hypothetical protein